MRIFFHLKIVYCFFMPNFSLSSPQIDVTELISLQRDQPSLNLIHVLSPEAYASAHIPDSVNICVYAVAFGDQVQEKFPDRATPLVVYGLSDETMESFQACERLGALGYHKVTRLAGGLKAWQEAGQPVEGTPPPPNQNPLLWPIDPTSSTILWTGRNRFNHHTGTLSLSEGFLEMTDGHPTQGEFTIDMASITCTDITDPQANAGLIGHLHHDDFFAVDQHPTAQFVLTKALRISECTDGTPTHQLFGDFTLRGITNPIEFTATIDSRAEGGWAAQALFSIDRTRWNVLYGSGRFFAKLGHHLVSDHVHLHLKIFTEPKPRE